MKVLKTNASSSKTTAEIDPFDGISVPASARKQIAEVIGEFLVEQTQMKLGDSESPVEGYGRFQDLSEAYADHKKEEIGHDDPNLEFSGKMRDALTFKTRADGTIEIGVFGSQATKADGHNNLSGESRLPTRRFIPGEGESYDSEITQQVEELIADMVGEQHEFERDDFEDVENKSGLYSVLTQAFDGFTRSEIRMAVLRNDKLVRMLDSLELLELL